MYDTLPGIDLRDPQYEGERGMLLLLEQLRALDVSDLMVRTTPVRVAFVRYGRFGKLDPANAVHVASWEEVFNQRHESTPHLKHSWSTRRSAEYGLRLPGGGIGRVRAWVMHGFNVSIRIHPARPRTLQELLPGNDERDVVIREFLRSLPLRRRGLIVIGGDVRSGKTSLENALYHDLNVSAPELGPELRSEGLLFDRRHVYIIGDPVEYYHQDERALFTHVDLAEGGNDQATEIKGSLRVPRSLVATGEMRGDPASTEASVIASLSGSVAVATGHFASTGDIVDRFSLGSEAMSEKSKVRLLSSAIQAVVTLKLLPGRDGREHLAVEYIDFDKKSNLRVDLKEGMLNLNTTLEDGLRPMAEDLKELVRLQRITEEVAFPNREWME